jgi:hypothetical protein
MGDGIERVFLKVARAKPADKWQLIAFFRRSRSDRPFCGAA